MGPVHPELHLLSQVGPMPPEWLVLRTHWFLQKRRNQVCLPLAQLSPTIVPSLWETRHPTRELGVWTVDSLASVSPSSPVFVNTEDAATAQPGKDLDGLRGTWFLPEQTPAAPPKPVTEDSALLQKTKMTRSQRRESLPFHDKLAQQIPLKGILRAGP